MVVTFARDEQSAVAQQRQAFRLQLGEKRSQRSVGFALGGQALRRGGHRHFWQPPTQASNDS